MDHLFIGLDVAKDRSSTSTSAPPGRPSSLSHDEAGLTALVDRVRTLAPTLIALEATGGYEATVAAILASAGLPVAVVNPHQVRDFAGAIGRLAKTDALDAEVIAPVCRAGPPGSPGRSPTRPRTGSTNWSAAAVRSWRWIGAEANRRGPKQAREPRLQRRLDAHLAWLQQEP